MFTIRQANLDDAQIIHELAHRIYYPTYTNILTQAQMDFMLHRSYTVAALQDSMRKDQDFFLAIIADQPVGFMALSNKDDQIIRIEKLYLLPDTQGKGLGTIVIDFAKEVALKRGKSIVELNVNRSNKAYFFYLKLGFKVIKEVDIPYFGYVLDDYVMQLCI